MRKQLFILLLVVISVSCSSTKEVVKSNSGNSSSGKQLNYGSPRVKQKLLDDLTFKIEEYSKDKTYGYTKENPIMVGGGSEGPKNERRFLNALAGPNGEILKYNRLGSCHPFKTQNGVFGNTGMLDKYSITYKGLKKEIILYINMYDSDTLKVPVGFTLREVDLYIR